ncbi:MAG: hypothetical protein PHX68_03160 [Alphaproteobacteria bacterium]|nr:hypothetical protein [Alphaproteobacteria bacterium]
MTDEQKPEDTKPAKIKLNSASISSNSMVKEYLRNGRMDGIPTELNLDNLGAAIRGLGQDGYNQSRIYHLIKELLPKEKYPEFSDDLLIASPAEYTIGNGSDFIRALENAPKLAEDTTTAMLFDVADRIAFPPVIATQIVEMRRALYRGKRKDILQSKKNAHASRENVGKPALSSLLAQRSQRAGQVKAAQKLKGPVLKGDILAERGWKEALAKRKPGR